MFSKESTKIWNIYSPFNIYLLLWGQAGLEAAFQVSLPGDSSSSPEHLFSILSGHKSSS